MDSDGLFTTGRPLGELTSVLDAEVIRPCLDVAFADGELRRAETVASEHGGRMFPDADDGPTVQLELETSTGDQVAFMIWQPEVEQFTTIAGMRAHLLSQLEDWLPETRLHWGEQIRLTMPAGGAAG